MAKYLTVDIGGTKTAVAVGSTSGKIVDRSEFSTGSPNNTIDEIISLAQPLITQHKPKAIGISCGGPLNSQEGMVLGPPNLPGWDNVAIVDRLTDALDLPAYLENDANAGALAEWMFGAGQGADNVLFLTCGTGIGAGLILDGHLYRGRQDLAGEIGHIRMEDDGPVGYFKAGSFEGYASGGGLGQLARRRLKEPHAASSLDAIAIDKVTGKDVGEAALAGDALAIELVTTLGTYLGKGLAILIDILNPECIVLGSMAVRLGKLLLDPAWEVIRKEALELGWSNCRIVPAQLSGHIGDVAALCAAIYNAERSTK